MIGFKKNSKVNMLAIFLVVGFLVVIGRLFQLQVLDHEKYSLMADQEHIKQLKIPAQRGRIFALDRGVPSNLVLNVAVYTLFLDPHAVAEAGDPAEIEKTIKEVAGGNLTADISVALEKTQSRYQIVATRLSRQQAELIKAKKLVGVGFHQLTERTYVEESLASQTLGFVNHEGKGQYGIEEALDSRLKGEDGLLQTVTDVNLVPLTIGDRNISHPAKNGDDIVLSIDKNIQLYTEAALKAGLDRLKINKGSALVFDPSTGQIMAMANFPSYDVKKYTQVQDVSLFLNPILTDPYEPGSIIKPFTLAVGIDKGIVSPNTTYFNRDTIVVEDRVIGNAVKGYTGNITMQTALNYSLNTGMVTVAQLLGDGSRINRSARDTMYDYFVNKFGFGRATNIELYEAAGRVISPDEDEGNAVRYSNMSFGQGMNLTMLQVASGFSTLINGGIYHAPTIIAGTYNDEVFEKSPPTPSEQVISPDTSATMRNMLVDARNVSFSRNDRPGFSIGGKTGTSETLVDGSYTKDATIASYIGFGGNETPKYVIIVRVQGEGMGLEGSQAAEPIFTDISNWILQYLNLKPKG